jgi:hypothetical protein
MVIVTPILERDDAHGGKGCTHSRGVSGWLHGPPELDLWVALTPGGCHIGYLGHQNSTYGLHSLPGGVTLVTWATRTRLMGCTHSRGVSDWLHGPPELDLWVALTPGCQICYMGYTGCCQRMF